MNLSEGQKKLVAHLLDQGIAKSAKQLAKISRKEWRIESPILSEGPGKRFCAYLGGSIQPHFGTYLSMQQANLMAVLILFPKKSGQTVAATFTENYDRAKRTPNWEKEAIAEISNILANAVAGPLADALGIAIILASPVISRGSKSELFMDALTQFDDNDAFVILANLSLSSSNISCDCSLIILLDKHLATYMKEATTQ